MKKKTLFSLSLLYGVLLLYLVFMHDTSSYSGRLTLTEALTHRANYLPFRSMNEYLTSVLEKRMNLRYALNFFAGNFVMLLPYGLVVSCLTREKVTTKCLLLGIAISLSIETVQLLMMIGSFDVDCMILRTAGIIVGGLIGTALHSFVKPYTSKVC